MTELKFATSAEFDAFELQLRAKYGIPKKNNRASDGVIQLQKVGTDRYTIPEVDLDLGGAIFAPVYEKDIREENLDARRLTQAEIDARRAKKEADPPGGRP